MSEQAKQFLDQATQSVQSGQFNEALSLVDQAIALNPSDSEAFVLRGIALAQTSQPDAATEAFRKAIMLSPYNPKAYFNLAVHQYQLGKKTEALEMAREALKIDPRHAGAKDLMTRLETEFAAAGQPVVPSAPVNPADPLSVPTTTSEEAPRAENPSGSVFTAPPAGAPAPGPYAPPTTPMGQMPPGYVRPGYEPVAGGAIPWVEGLGGKWTLIGWILAVASLAGLGLTIAILAPFFSSIATMSDPTALSQQMSTSPLYIVANIVSYGSLLGIVLWSILDLVNRRGNFLWLLPNILCSCCGFGWLVLPIYLLVGRND